MIGLPLPGMSDPDPGGGEDPGAVAAVAAAATSRNGDATSSAIQPSSEAGAWVPGAPDCWSTPDPVPASPAHAIQLCTVTGEAAW